MLIPVLFPQGCRGYSMALCFKQNVRERNYPNDRLVMAKQFPHMKAIPQTNRSSYHETKSSNPFSTIQTPTRIWDAGESFSALRVLLT